MSDCVRGSIWSYANIDVLNKYGYNACGHTVTPKKENTQIREFKTYIHKFPGKSLYLGGIYHNGTKQYGFKYINSCHTDLAVYYWSYDDANFCPLLIRVTKTWWSWNSDYYHEYYAQTGINTNQWTKDGIGDNVYSGFQKIINEECFKRVVVLNLSQTNNGSQYGVDGKPNSEVNPTVKIQVSGPTNVHTDYRKYIHRLSSGSMNILCTKHEGKHRPFQKFVLSTPYNEAYIYYSSKDTGHTKPLILQLGAGSDFYKLDGGEKWVHDSKITSKGLKDALDKENDTHVIDIFQNKGQYQCTSPNCDKYIQVQPTQVDTHKYTKRKHRLQTSPPNFSVSSFIGSSGNKLQTGLSSISNVTEVNVFWYPNDGSSKPLLINYQLSNEHKWYKKTKVANTWKEVSEKDLGKPTSPSDQAKIKKLLIGASSPEVTIKIEQVPGSSYISDDQTVKIDRTGAADANGYSQITHRIDGKTFIIKSVTHGDNLQTVQGTTTFSKDPLTEVSVFYSDFDSKLSKPLLLELKLHNTQTTYKYYEKTKKQMNGSYLTRNKETNMLEIL